MRPGQNRCSRCGARRAEFYEICLRQDRERSQLRAASSSKGTKIGLLMLWLVTLFFLVVAGYHYLEGEIAAARVACATGLVYLGLALFLTKAILSAPCD